MLFGHDTVARKWPKVLSLSPIRTMDSIETHVVDPLHEIFNYIICEPYDKGFNEKQTSKPIEQLKINLLL